MNKEQVKQWIIRLDSHKKIFEFIADQLCGRQLATSEYMQLFSAVLGGDWEEGDFGVTQETFNNWLDGKRVPQNVRGKIKSTLVYFAEKLSTCANNSHGIADWPDQFSWCHPPTTTKCRDVQSVVLLACDRIKRTRGENKPKFTSNKINLAKEKAPPNSKVPIDGQYIEIDGLEVLKPVQDLPRSTPEQRREVVAFYPSWKLLKRGLYLNRPLTLDSMALSYDAWRTESADAFRVPVFALTGRQGDGKSILLLQLAAKLLAENPNLAIFQLKKSADVIEVLSKIASDTDRLKEMVLLVDDLHKTTPDDAANLMLQELAEQLEGISLIACGPSPNVSDFSGKLKAFNVQIYSVPPVTLKEVVAFKDWFQIEFDHDSGQHLTLVELLFLGKIDEPISVFTRNYFEFMKTLGAEEFIEEVLVFNALDIAAPFTSDEKLGTILIDLCGGDHQSSQNLPLEIVNEVWGKGWRIAHNRIALMMIKERMIATSRIAGHSFKFARFGQILGHALLNPQLTVKFVSQLRQNLELFTEKFAASSSEADQNTTTIYDSIVLPNASDRFPFVALNLKSQRHFLRNEAVDAQLIRKGVDTYSSQSELWNNDAVNFALVGMCIPSDVRSGSKLFLECYQRFPALLSSVVFASRLAFQLGVITPNKFQSIFCENWEQFVLNWDHLAHLIKVGKGNNHTWNILYRYLYKNIDNCRYGKAICKAIDFDPIDERAIGLAIKWAKQHQNLIWTKEIACKLLECCGNNVAASNFMEDWMYRNHGSILARDVLCRAYALDFLPDKIMRMLKTWLQKNGNHIIATEIVVTILKKRHEKDEFSISRDFVIEMDYDLRTKDVISTMIKYDKKFEYIKLYDKFIKENESQILVQEVICALISGVRKLAYTDRIKYYKSLRIGMNLIDKNLERKNLLGLDTLTGVVCRISEDQNFLNRIATYLEDNEFSKNNDDMMGGLLASKLNDPSRLKTVSISYIKKNQASPGLYKVINRAWKKFPDDFVLLNYAKSWYDMHSEKHKKLLSNELIAKF